MIPRRVAEIALVCLGGLFLAISGAVLEQRQAQKVDTYSSYDARSGGYRAWYELLEREGLPVTRFERRPAFLDPSLSSLIVSKPLPFDTNVIPATAIDRAALGDWVARGGTLIELGAWLPVSDSPFKHVHFAALSARALRAMGVRNTVSQSRPVVRRGTYRRGTILLVSDETMFDNGRIARADNARLAYVLAQPKHGGMVAFDEVSHGYLVPEHWWLVAPRRLVLAVLLSALVVALAAVGAAIRLGPPLIPALHRAATSSEYLDAVASLYARAHTVRKPLADVLASVKRVVATSLALPDDLASKDLARRIASSDLRGAFAELETLATSPAPRERELVRGVKLAHLLRKEFETYGRHRP